MMIQGKRAVITGGSTGIGLAIARAFAQNGASVWLVARGEEKLSQARQALRWPMVLTTTGTTRPRANIRKPKKGNAR